jgi:hypothetical protein
MRSAFARRYFILTAVIATVLIATALMQATAVAQEQPPIVVTAERSQAHALAFVDQVALGIADNAFARWEDRVCVGTSNLAQPAAQALVDRISARAQAVGLRTGQPGCTANIMVIYASDSDALTRQIVDRRRDLLGFFAEDGRLTAGRAAMEEFASTPRPVRWWHVSSKGVGSLRPDVAQTRQNSGQTGAFAAAASEGTGDYGGQGSAADLQGADAVRTSGSRARPTVRNDLNYVLVVVDARRVVDVPATAWMDYVAMVSLAQLDPDARPTGYPTILNLFNTPDAGLTEMTRWDVAFLDGLYRARSMESSRQAADIARRMTQ